MTKIKGAEVQFEGSSGSKMAEKTKCNAKDGSNSKEHNSDLTIEKGAPVSNSSKITRPRSPSSNTPYEEIYKRPAINNNINARYVAYQELNGSNFRNLHQNPCISNSFPRPHTCPISDRPNNSPYLPNQNYLPTIYPKIGTTSLIYPTHKINIESYNWENSVPFRPSFNWSNYGQSQQIQSQTLYDTFVHSVDPPSKSDSESMKISPNISEHEETQSNNISLPPLTKVNNSNNNNDNHNNNMVDEVGGEGSNEVTSSNSLSYKTGQTGQLNNGESKELKLFKNALAEFIKELLRPAWQNGILSKDNHKRIVRKSVEKVTGSMKNNLVPNNEEVIKQYLSMYKPKIQKLLQDYLEIYGKSEERDLDMEVNSAV